MLMNGGLFYYTITLFIFKDEGFWAVYNIMKIQQNLQFKQR